MFPIFGISIPIFGLDRSLGEYTQFPIFGMTCRPAKLKFRNFGTEKTSRPNSVGRRSFVCFSFLLKCNFCQLFTLHCKHIFVNNFIENNFEKTCIYIFLMYLCPIKTKHKHQTPNTMNTTQNQTAEFNVNKVIAYFMLAVTILSTIVCVITEKVS